MSEQGIAQNIAVNIYIKKKDSICTRFINAFDLLAAFYTSLEHKDSNNVQKAKVCRNQSQINVFNLKLAIP